MLPLSTNRRDDASYDGVWLGVLKRGLQLCVMSAKILQMQQERDISLTSGYQMKDTGFSLKAKSVFCPAKDSTVVSARVKAVYQL